MKGIVNSFTVTANFWEVNPQLVVVFKDVYDTDKSKGKVNSSKNMWTIALIYDPESKFKNLPLEDRIKIIEENFCKIENIGIIDKYKELVTTPAQRHLIQWNNVMEEKSKLLSTLKYDIDSWEVIEKMLIGNTKLYAELERIQDMLSKEGEEGIGRGGSVESASESKFI